MRARAAENTSVIVNGAWRGETCCDKQTRRGRGKNTEAPPLRPFLPSLSVFFDGATNLFLVVVAHFLVFGRKRNRRRDDGCGEVGSRRGPTCDRSRSSGGVIFTLTGSRSSRGREREREGCQMAPPRPPPWRNPRKGRDQILQRSVAEP